MGFADVTIESIMGLLFAPSSVLGNPCRVPIVNLSAGFQYWKKPAFREVRAQ